MQPSASGLVLVVDSGGREQQIVIQGDGWTVLVPETLS